jgi:hypothetical protein
MFLLRTAFWISVVLVLLPSGETKPAPEAPKVDAFDAISAATSAVADMGQFCTRNPEACETGAHAAAAFGQRAQAGAKMVYDFLSERLETGSVPSDAGKKPADGKNEKQVKSQHTLKQNDLAPAYRGPQPRREAEKLEPRDKRG